MATISKQWAAAATIMNAVAVTTGSTSSTVDLVTNGHEGAQVTVDANFPATPTDNLIVEVYGSLDGVAFDKTPVYSQEIDNGVDPNQISILIQDLAYFNIIAKRSGSTDTITVTIVSRAWNWQSV